MSGRRVSLMGFALVVLAGALLSSGCGEPKAKVTGTVFYKGKKIDSGQVSLMSDKGGIPYTGEVQQDGNYTVTGVPYGDYTVTVIQYPKDFKAPGEVKDRKEQEGGSARPKEALKKEPKNQGVPSLLPQKFASHQSTTLKVKVDQAEVTKELTLAD